jgi:hypothetical protein
VVIPRLVRFFVLNAGRNRRYRAAHLQG